MLNKCKIKRLLERVCRSTIGRRRLSRVGRFLLNAGRMDGDNDPMTNGEFIFLSEILKAGLLEKDSVVFFDIGANTGLVSVYAASILEERGMIFAAEPCDSTFANLVSKTKNLRTAIVQIQAAFSNKDGSGQLHVVDTNAGTNSLVQETTDSTRIETVKLFRLDSYATENDIKHIDFVKIDAEGHDFSVLQGCERLLENSAITALQFEYNWRWIGQRSFLRDVFQYMEKFPEYMIGKVTSLGIEGYTAWSPNIETLVENNYAIIHTSRIDTVRTITPWYEL